MKRLIALMTAVVMLFALASVALAGSSGGGSTGQDSGSGGTPASTPASTTTTQQLSDGTKVETTTTKTDNGSTVKEVKTVDKDGNETAKIEETVSQKALEEAQKSAGDDGETVITTDKSVAASDDADTATVYEITLPSGSVDKVDKVEIPVTNLKPSTVAILVDENGNETIVTDTLMTENGITIPADQEKVTLKIVNNEVEFTDSEEVSKWAQDATDYMAARELIVGDQDGNIKPKETATFAQAAVIIGRLANAGLNDKGEGWAEAPIAWVNEQSMNPEGSTKNDGVTLQQVAYMLYANAGSPETKGDLTQFGDAESVSSVYAQALAWCVEQGFVMGDGLNLNAASVLTNEQLNTIYYRVLNG